MLSILSIKGFDLYQRTENRVMIDVLPYALGPMRYAFFASNLQFLFLCARLHRQNCVFGTDLSADRTTRAQVCINFNPVIPDIESRAGQRADAIFVVFTFYTYMERLAFG
jgi:hypothetical protein